MPGVRRMCLTSSSSNLEHELHCLGHADGPRGLVPVLRSVRRFQRSFVRAVVFELTNIPAHEGVVRGLCVNFLERAFEVHRPRVLKDVGRDTVHFNHVPLYLHPSARARHGQPNRKASHANDTPCKREKRVKQQTVLAQTLWGAPLSLGPEYSSAEFL